MHLKTLEIKAKRFGRKLERIRRDHAEIAWFPYPILENVKALDGLLSGENRRLFRRLKGGTVADLGGADGDLAFLLERQGFEVDLVDMPSANYNGLEGARTLAKALGSSVAIYELDLDTLAPLPRPCYDLVLLLGTLYHLKNPFGVLEGLARVSRYLLVSTRVARYARRDGVAYHDEPMAYLLDAAECNDDATNFWIFSEAGLKRLVSRCGWRVLDYTSYGETSRSTPQDPDGDERAWMLLESQAFDA
ncbi:MAG: methyltransferase domain-containing protein [Xanthomonadales bacterium]|nr:methyltransferase domain-containing protein [Xanthomonadales bacterium]